MRKRDRYIRFDEFGQMLQVETSFVEELVRNGQIRAFRLPNGELRLDPQSVRDFLLACELDVRTHFVAVVE
jgi:predicted site-specific integrase-resolvase